MEFTQMMVARWKDSVVGPPYFPFLHMLSLRNCHPFMWVVPRGLVQAQAGQHEATAFVALLRACATDKDLCSGSRLHHHILQRGLLTKYSDALVTMYAKCGSLAKAKDLFDTHRSKDLCTWNALISAYTQQGQGKDALHCFEWMQHEGIPPDAVTFTYILKACGSIGAADKGEQIHNEITKHELLGNNIAVGNALVNMYAKCGALAKAYQVLQELPARNVISWNALIAGYAQHGEGEQALICFDKMQHEGLFPNTVTFICVLKACGSIGAINKGERIHDEIAKQGMLANNIALGTALVDMYAKCGALMKAQQVLEELPLRNAVSWNALIAGYAQRGDGGKAWDCFEQMQCEGLCPEAVTYICILKACGSIRAVDKGARIHEDIAKEGLLTKDIALGNALVDMYVKCGALAKALQVVEELPVRNVICWSTLISGYAQQGEGKQALACFDRMQSEGLCPNAITFICVLKACGTIRAVAKGDKIHDQIVKQGLLRSDIVLGTALVDMYAKCGALVKARRVLGELPVRNVISWNALISGTVQQGEGEQTLDYYEQMQHEGLRPNVVTFICILKACGIIRAAGKGEKIHDEIAKQGLLRHDIALGTALVDMYAKCGALAKAQGVLEELHVRDVIPWNALITNCVQQGEAEQALSCFEQMQCDGLNPDAVTFNSILEACASLGAAEKGEKIHDEIAKQGLLGTDIVLGTALVDMYAKCGKLAKARQVLEELPSRDVISWNVLITGYVQQGEGEEALKCFDQMQHEGLVPDAVTFMCILKACASIGAAEKGEKLHEVIAKQELLGKDILLGTALVDMYAKCGAFAKARQVLEELPVKDVVSWNALITGFVQQGEAEQALTCFEQMQHEDLSPDAVTFSSVLSACSRLGLVKEAQTHFLNMSRKYDIKPDLTHYTCIIDLFGHRGHLGKAVEVIEKMPCSDSVVWSALLCACQKWGDVNVGRWAFEQAVQVDRTDAALYVLMANIYAAAGMQEEAYNIEALQIENKAWEKSPHGWWSDIRGKASLFSFGDAKNKSMHLKLEGVAGGMLHEEYSSSLQHWNGATEVTKDENTNRPRGIMKMLMKTQEAGEYDVQ